MAKRRTRRRSRVPIRRRWWFRGGARVARFAGKRGANGARRAGSYTRRVAKHVATEDGRRQLAEAARQRRLKRRRWAKQDLGTYRCYGCGQTLPYRRSTRKHVCPGPKAPTPTARPARPRTPPRPKATPSPTRGARIVRAGTAAERFANLASAEPETVHDFEQLCHDIVQGMLALATEMEDLADRVDLDRRVTAKIEGLAEQIADLAEPARTIRTTFRRVYRHNIAAMEEGVKQPANAKFFEAG